MTEVQSLLGHASPEITLRIYSHWFKAADSGAVDRLSKVILGNGVSPKETRKKWAISGHSNGRAAAANLVST